MDSIWKKYYKKTEESGGPVITNTDQSQPSPPAATTGCLLGHNTTVNQAPAIHPYTANTGHHYSKPLKPLCTNNNHEKSNADRPSTCRRPAINNNQPSTSWGNILAQPCDSVHQPPPKTSSNRPEKPPAGATASRTLTEHTVHEQKTNRRALPPLQDRSRSTSPQQATNHPESSPAVTIPASFQDNPSFSKIRSPNLPSFCTTVQRLKKER